MDSMPDQLEPASRNPVAGFAGQNIYPYVNNLPDARVGSRAFGEFFALPDSSNLADAGAERTGLA